MRESYVGMLSPGGDVSTSTRGAGCWMLHGHLAPAVTRRNGDQEQGPRHQRPRLRLLDEDVPQRAHAAVDAKNSEKPDVRFVAAGLYQSHSPCQATFIVMCLRSHTIARTAVRSGTWP